MTNSSKDRKDIKLKPVSYIDPATVEGKDSQSLQEEKLNNSELKNILAEKEGNQKGRRKKGQYIDLDNLESIDYQSIQREMTSVKDKKLNAQDIHPADALRKKLTERTKPNFIKPINSKKTLNNSKEK